MHPVNKGILKNSYHSLRLKNKPIYQRNVPKGQAIHTVGVGDQHKRGAWGNSSSFFFFNTSFYTLSSTYLFFFDTRLPLYKHHHFVVHVHLWFLHRPSSSSTELMTRIQRTCAPYNTVAQWKENDRSFASSQVIYIGAMDYHNELYE